MARQNAAAAARLQLEIKDSGQNLFLLLDVDGDGVLSPRELRQAAAVLTGADKNHDGLLGGDELPQIIEFVLERGVGESSEAKAGSSRMAVRSTAKAGTTGPLWFRKMDRNNDGDLSASEFIGPLETFRKLDTNGDGFIDRDEAEAAGK
jgi:Ca2+-binding EF-hand superfamily protein